LRKLANLETQVGETNNAVKTNLEIITLLEKRKDQDRAELVRQLITLASAEASAGNLSQAKKYQQRAADLNFVGADPAATNLSIVDLADHYARKGALKEARAALLQAARRQSDLNTSDHTVSTRELVRACEKQNNFSEAKVFFEDAIAFEQNRDAQSVVLNLYRLDFADLLLRESGSSSGSSQKARLIKQSEDLFQTAADGLIAAQGQNSRALGAGVQRRAFQLTLNGFKDQGETLLDKYRVAASNSGGATLSVDTNVGAPP
jgi:tetratricopeptide (TPR) repeat protein